MNIKTVPTGRGLDWITEGFGLFRLNPFTWIVIFVIFVVLMALLSALPLVGSIIALALQPVLLGGMLLGCRDLAEGRELRIEHLFDGFNQDAKPLALVGVLSALAYAAVGVVVFMVVGGALGLSYLGGMMDQQALAMGGAMLGFMLSGLVGLALSVPIAMATWFAPALVLFAGLPALEAMRTSFVACLRNLLPFLLYGVVALLLAALAAIPFGLGMLVLVPTLVASVYVGYRDIFED